MIARNCTFSGNTAIQHGGAIANSGTLDLNHCTVAGNTATNGFGGGLRITASGGNTHFENTIVADNQSGAANPDINLLFGTVTTAGANLVGDNSGVDASFPAGPLVGTSATPLDPLLAPLGFHGGATPTRPPGFGSPAVDAAVATDRSPSADQRGLARPLGAGPDIGAYETGHAAAGYRGWAAERIPAGEDDDFEGNAERDPNANGIEYATGRDPWTAEPGDVLSMDLAPKPGGGFTATFVFAYEPDAPDLRYRLTRNNNLGTFFSRYVFNTFTGVEQLHPGGNVSATRDPVAGTITVVDSGIGAAGTEFFYRLETDLQP